MKLGTPEYTELSSIQISGYFTILHHGHDNINVRVVDRFILAPNQQIQYISRWILTPRRASSRTVYIDIVYIRVYWFLLEFFHSAVKSFDRISPSTQTLLNTCHSDNSSAQGFYLEVYQWWSNQKFNRFSALHLN